MGRPPSLFDRLGPLVANIALAAAFLASPFAVIGIALFLGLPPALAVPLALLAPLVVASLPGLRLYPVSAVGPRERVDDDTFRGGAERCAACGAVTEQGLRRRYARQWVLFGVPLYTLDWGENAYCPDCVDPSTLTVIGPDDGSLRASEGIERNDAENGLAQGGAAESGATERAVDPDSSVDRNVDYES